MTLTPDSNTPPSDLGSSVDSGVMPRIHRSVAIVKCKQTRHELHLAPAGAVDDGDGDPIGLSASRGHRDALRGRCGLPGRAEQAKSWRGPGAMPVSRPRDQAWALVSSRPRRGAGHVTADEGAGEHRRRSSRGRPAAGRRDDRGPPGAPSSPRRAFSPQPGAPGGLDPICPGFSVIGQPGCGKGLRRTRSDCRTGTGGLAGPWG
jgi:hypothetical protein